MRLAVYASMRAGRIGPLSLHRGSRELRALMLNTEGTRRARRPSLYGFRKQWTERCLVYIRFWGWNPVKLLFEAERMNRITWSLLGTRKSSRRRSRSCSAAHARTHHARMYLKAEGRWKSSITKHCILFNKERHAKLQPMQHA